MLCFCTEHSLASRYHAMNDSIYYLCSIKTDRFAVRNKRKYMLRCLFAPRCLKTCNIISDSFANNRGIVYCTVSTCSVKCLLRNYVSGNSVSLSLRECLKPNIIISHENLWWLFGMSSDCKFFNRSCREITPFCVLIAVAIGASD